MAQAFAHQLYNWTDTKLWELLQNSQAKEAERVRVMLEGEMPQIQALLSQGSTSPTDFTLHDSQHSYRVAQRMSELMPEATLTGLSPYELALLLLAAYLYDIGMTPPQSLINQLTNLIVLGVENSFTQKEFAAFRDWTDTLDDDISQLLLSRPLKTPEDLHFANLLIMHYCRHRHVALSEQWIDANLGKIPLGSYAQWLADLKLLCRSHNEGYDFLTSKQFDPKPAGTPGHIVHLRFLASVLRVADVIEFDPERTPEVIFTHRSISPGSEIFWFKDHYPTLTMEQGQLTVTANPPDAKLHRAIELMCDGIEAELRVVSRLKDEHDFKHSSFQSVPTYHDWIISPNLRRNISSLNGQYEYIDGAFRPDTKKLLQLLSGKRLYKDEKVALRELLQNAFDAVRERIALERLTKVSPQDDTWNLRLSQIYTVTLDVHTSDGRTWITCTDDGVGMSKAIITQFLLVSGLAQRGDLRHLERRCHENGFRLDRTGQFGIGVLSYFMVADLVRFTTKRNALCSDAENSGWVFETEGIGSFGELRPSGVSHLGTEVSLRLRRDIETRWLKESDDRHADWLIGKPIPSTSPMFFSILQYLVKSLCHIPCKVLINENGSTIHSIEPGWNASPGFTRKDIRIATHLWRERPEQEDDLIPKQQLESLEATNRRARFYLEQYEKYLSWRVFDGVLRDASIAYRFWLPIFKSNEGESPGFAITENRDGALFLHPTSSEFPETYFSRPEGTVKLSWKGMHVDFGTEYRDNLTAVGTYGIIQIDFRSESVGLLSVSRETIQLNKDGASAVDEVLATVKKCCASLSGRKDSPWSSLWELLATGRVDASTFPSWPHSISPATNVLSWTPFKPPALNIWELDRNVREAIHRITWEGTPVTCLDDIRIQTFVRLFHTNGETGSEIVRWSSWNDTWSIDRVVKMAVAQDFLLVGLHTNEQRVLGKPGVQSCDFPPEWSRLVGIPGRRGAILNRGCPLVAAENDASRKWFEERFSSVRPFEKKNFDPRPFKHEICLDLSKAASWLRFIVQHIFFPVIKDLWIALIESEQDFIRSICAKFQGEVSDELLFVSQHGFSIQIACVGYKGVKFEDDPERGHQLLPDPLDSKWLISAELKDSK